MTSLKSLVDKAEWMPGVRLGALEMAPGEADSRGALGERGSPRQRLSSGALVIQGAHSKNSSRGGERLLGSIFSKIPNTVCFLLQRSTANYRRTHIEPSEGLPRRHPKSSIEGPE